MPSSTLLLSSTSVTPRPNSLTSHPPSNLTFHTSSTNISVLHTPSQTPLSIFPAHTSPLTSLSLHAIPPTHLLLFATSSDGTLAIFQGDSKHPDTWTEETRLQAHDNQPCVDSAACDIAGIGTVCVSGGMEAELKVWKRDTGDWRLIATGGIGEGGGNVLVEVIAMRPLEGGSGIIAMGGTDRRVWLFGLEAGKKEGGNVTLKKVGVLEGHRDWVRGLSFSSGEHAFYLASASKDATARVWRVERELREDLEGFDVHSAHVGIEVNGCRWAFVADGLLAEHSAAVHSVSFSSIGENGRMRLVTSSMDCSVALWQKEGQRWDCVARFGLMGGSSAHALGFFGAVFAAESGEEVIGHNFGGALHCWREQSRENKDVVEMLARPAPGGHFAAVTGLAWDPRGRYLLTCGQDKTARVFAEVAEEGGLKFVEWARPQIHGHGIHTVAFCGQDGRRYVSGAEERMLRMFEAPSSFGMPGESGTEASNSGGYKAVGAMVPELGLSNKATFEEEKDGNVSVNGDRDGNGSNEGGYGDMVVSSFGANRGNSVIPLEEELKQQRLWPETAKLYGHGNEISCVAVDMENAVLASACRAQTTKDAMIILWDSTNGMECGLLTVHDLTVNEMRFSENAEALVSVSRDRSFAILRRTKKEQRFGMEVVHHKKKAHTRLIYCCSWLLGDAFVATGGRDKCLKIFAAEKYGEWEIGEEVFKQKFGCGVSALDGVWFEERDGLSVLAVGFENGDIRLVEVRVDSGQIVVTQMFSTAANSRCGGRVNKVAWRPQQCVLEGEKAKMQLGIASEDHSVRVVEYQVALSKQK